ncbi:MAG TPA: type IV pilin [Methanoculleus sp.]|nr:type IV pilin [Methanoculleus sp.]
MKLQDNEEATSPVIGVILMVAVTMILAAIIAVQVFGMPQDVDNANMVAVSAKQVGDQIQVTYMGSSSANQVTLINASSYNGGVYNASGELPNPQLGDQVLFNGATRNLDRVVVVATFDNGNSQVIFDEVI